MAAQEFGGGMHHDIGAPFDRPDQVGRGQGVVHDQRHARVMGDFGHGLDVGDDAAGIGDAFDEDRAGAVIDAGLETVGLGAHRPNALCQSNLAKPWLNWLIEPP